MLDDGRYTAVLDRIEEEQAVLVLERDGRAVDDLVVDLDVLPAAGREPDTVLDVVVEQGTLVSVTANPAETADRQARARSRFERLARRLPRQGAEADEVAPDTGEDTEHGEQADTDETEVTDVDADDEDDATEHADQSGHPDQPHDDRPE